MAEALTDRVCVPGAPAAACHLAKAPDAEYLIAVDAFGVRLLSMGCRPWGRRGAALGEFQ